MKTAKWSKNIEFSREKSRFNNSPLLFPKKLSFKTKKNIPTKDLQEAVKVFAQSMAVPKQFCRSKLKK